MVAPGGSAVSYERGTPVTPETGHGGRSAGSGRGVGRRTLEFPRSLNRNVQSPSVGCKDLAGLNQMLVQGALCYEIGGDFSLIF